MGVVGFRGLFGFEVWGKPNPPFSGPDGGVGFRFGFKQTLR